MKKKIKVVHLSNFDVGIQIHMRNQMLYLRKQGYDISIICNPGQIVKGDMYTPDGIFVKAIAFSHKITPFKDLAALFKLISYFRKEKFDIVHTHTIKPGLYGRLAARIAGVPIVLHTIHGFHFHDEMHPLAVFIYKWVEKFGAFFSDLIFSQNREDIAVAEKSGIAPAGKLKYLGNGIDIDTFNPARVSPALVSKKRSELGFSESDKIVCMVGRLVAEKGFREYCEAVRIISKKGLPIKFIAIGAVHHKAGALDPRELIKKNKLEDTMFFLGRRNDVADIMAAVDLVALPSYAEGIPRVLMEAGAMGKPVVGTDVRGTREIVKDNITGRLIPVKDAVSLADAIVEIISDPNKMQNMGAAARELALDMFDERIYFRRTDREYRRLVKDKISEDKLEGLKPILVK